MTVDPAASARSSRSNRGAIETVENVAIGALAAASAWALGAAMLEPALIAIAVLTPVAVAMALRGSR